MSCIYCGEAGIFNGEHVFSAGLGGDDKRYMLHDAVCKACNTNFAKLETELLQKSPTALARIAMQPGGRSRGGKRREPTYTTDATYLIDESGRLLEAYISVGMVPVILPQIHIEGKSVGLTATESEDLKAFNSALQSLIGVGEFRLIVKMDSEEGTRYFVSKVTREPGGYTIDDGVELQRPPAEGLWLQVVKPDKKITHRFYRNKNGGLNYKTSQEDSLLESLMTLEKYFAQYELPESFSVSVVDKPLMQVESSPNMSMADRVIAKIGVNFVAYLQGADYVRNAGFEEIKRSILYGNPQMPWTHSDDDHVAAIIGKPPKDCHALMLGALPNSEGLVTLYMVLKLYGSTVHRVKLADSVPSPGWDEPKFYLINYVEHVIEPISMLEYMRSYCEIGEFLGQA